MSSVYIIRNKETLVQWVAESGKRSWAAPAHAKNAFAVSPNWQAKDPLLSPIMEEKGYKRTYQCWKGYERTYYTSLKFKEQDVYEIVELSPDADLQVMVAAELLREVVDKENICDKLHYKIERFLEELV